MGQITEFSSETCEKLGYYVYRLIDPRDGTTFYVGKGQGNRVFEHAKGALALMPVPDDADDADTPKEDELSLKYKTIQDIVGSGLDVVHVIHRHGLLDEATAYEVESALIDAYPGLTNVQDGHGSDYGCANAAELERRYNLQVIESFTEKCLIIKIRPQTIYDRMDEHGIPVSDYHGGVYQAVRYEWHLARWRAEQVEYVIASVGGVVKGVFRPDKWLPYASGRIGFEGVPAPAEVAKKYMGKLIPKEIRTGKGKANPCLYTF